MFYLFILESIGTSELMLIGLVALIVFGPRKLPDLARTIGKTMAEFRRSTDDFKKTWEQEIAFEDEKKNPEMLSDLRTENTIGNESSISRDSPPLRNEIYQPEIKEIDGDVFNRTASNEETEGKETPEIAAKSSDKRDWL